MTENNKLHLIRAMIELLRDYAGEYLQEAIDLIFDLITVVIDFEDE